MTSAVSNNKQRIAFSVHGSFLRGTILRWHLYCAITVAMAAAIVAGVHGAISALLGGFITWFAGLVFALIVSGDRIRTAGETLRIMFRAEASKIMLIVLLLWLVLTTYTNVVPAAFFAAFIASVLVSQAALLIRETRGQ
ncbi:MAG: hypothetical protein JWN94_3189 [Betaproteobacteria bacterium]|nr:hypothetical protein [Betaproteobacteria bacterium]